MDLEILRYIAIAVIILMMLWYIIKHFRTDRKLPGIKQAELLAHLKHLKLDSVTFSEDEPFDKWIDIKGARPVSRVRCDNSVFEYVEIMVLGRSMGLKSFLLDYTFRVTRLDKRSRTKETSFKFSKSRGYHWWGDLDLANGLNQDEVLSNKIVPSGLSEQYLSVVPEPFAERARLRLLYNLPTSEQFNLLEDIARRVQALG